MHKLSIGGIHQRFAAPLMHQQIFCCAAFSSLIRNYSTTQSTQKRRKRMKPAEKHALMKKAREAAVWKNMKRNPKPVTHEEVVQEMKELKEKLLAMPESAENKSTLEKIKMCEDILTMIGETQGKQVPNSEEIRTTIESSDYYKKKYSYAQTADIMDQGIDIQIPAFKGEKPDKPFDQMSPQELRAYQKEMTTKQFLQAKVKIPKPRVDAQGKYLTQNAIMNASNAKIDQLLSQSSKERKKLEGVAMDSSTRKEWEAVLSMEDQLKQLLRDEENPYTPIRPDHPSFFEVARVIIAMFLAANVLLGLTSPGVRALVFRPLFKEVETMLGKRSRE